MKDERGRLAIVGDFANKLTGKSVIHFRAHVRRVGDHHPGLLAAAYGQRHAPLLERYPRNALLFRRVIFPIAIRQALPAYGNEVILMVKATSLASTITIMEMTGIANTIMAENYRPMEAFIVAGSFYLTLNFIMTRLIQIIEWRLSGHLRPPKISPVSSR